MDIQYASFVNPQILSAVTTAALSIYALRHRRVPQAVTFSLLMFLLTIWTGFDTLHHLSSSLGSKYFWMQMKYLGSGSAPAIWLIFALQFTRLDKRINRVLVAVLGALVLLTWVIVFTNDAHRWMWPTRELIPGENTMLVSHGFYFWVYFAGSTASILGSFVLFIRFYFTSTGIYRKQAAALMIGGATPLAASIAHDIFGWDPVPPLDLAILSLWIPGVIFAWAIFRYRILDLLPIAHHLVIQNMRSGVMVVDAKERVVFCNPAGLEILERSHTDLIGTDLQAAVRDWPRLFKELIATSEQQGEVKRDQDGKTSFYEVSTSPVADRNGHYVGRLITLNDISERKGFEARLEHMAITDPLTGCYNRRHFYEVAHKEMLRARRFGHPLAIILLDLDRFKSVNDTYGHALGDQVLQAFADLCRENTCQIDIFARYGGKEFILLLPETPGDQARLLAERLRLLVENETFGTHQGGVQITVSAGVGELTGSEDKSIEFVIDCADRALYHAKQTGRNKVEVWEKTPAM